MEKKRQEHSLKKPAHWPKSAFLFLVVKKAEQIAYLTLLSIFTIFIYSDVSTWSLNRRMSLVREFYRCLATFKLIFLCRTLLYLTTNALSIRDCYSKLNLRRSQRTSKVIISHAIFLPLLKEINKLTKRLSTFLSWKLVVALLLNT